MFLLAILKIVFSKMPKIFQFLSFQVCENSQLKKSYSKVEIIKIVIIIKTSRNNENMSFALTLSKFDIGINANE